MYVIMYLTFISIQIKLNRICTIEAVELLLRELGEGPEVSTTLSDALQIITATAAKTGTWINNISSCNSDERKSFRNLNLREISS